MAAKYGKIPVGDAGKRPSIGRLLEEIEKSGPVGKGAYIMRRIPLFGFC